MKKLLKVINDEQKWFIIESVKISALFAWFILLYIAVVCIFS